MAGMGMDMGITQGAALAGSVMNSIGSAQGLRALAAERRRQLAEQEKLEKENVAATGASIANSNPNLLAEQATADMAAPGQAYLEKLGTYQPVGLSISQQTAAAPQLQAGLRIAMDDNQQLARENGDEVAAMGLRTRQADLEDRKAGIRSKGRRLAALYELRDQQAAQRGEGLRNGGNMLVGLSGMASGMSTGGRKPIYDTPT